MVKPIIAERVLAQIQGHFVLFLIGMGMNKWWKPHKWLPPARAMMRMQKELRAIPSEESGCLGAMVSGGLTIQYRRSFDHLEGYAHAKRSYHLPAWGAFNRSIKDGRGDVGIWHETFLVRAGEYETLYSGMPLHGLARAASYVPAEGAMSKARSRLTC